MSAEREVIELEDVAYAEPQIDSMWADIIHKRPCQFTTSQGTKPCKNDARYRVILPEGHVRYYYCCTPHLRVHDVRLSRLLLWRTRSMDS